MSGLYLIDFNTQIVDWDAALQTLNAYEQIPLTKKQLQQTNILATAKDLYDQSPSEYLRYRLGLLLKMWRNIIQIDASKVHTPRRSASHSVFEAVMMDDERFFNTKSVPELLDRLLKSFDRNYKVHFVSFLSAAFSMCHRIYNFSIRNDIFRCLIWQRCCIPSKRLRKSKFHPHN